MNDLEKPRDIFTNRSLLGEQAALGTSRDPGDSCTNFARTLRHVAIIPDGNRRWARRAGLAPEEGHRRGFLVAAPQLLQHLWQQGIPYTTLWLFSTENWQRSEGEVAHLMQIYGTFLLDLAPVCMELGTQMRHLGFLHRLPPRLAAIIQNVEAQTAKLSASRFYFALDYGARSDLVELLRVAVASGLTPDEIQEDTVPRLLKASGLDIPKPDLIVRTSGEQRLSGFLPLHNHYSELYFTDTLFPDLTCEELDQAIRWYDSRQRRFGH